MKSNNMSQLSAKEDSRFEQGFGVSGNFKFLPGHRRRIVNFITLVKQELSKKPLKRSKQGSVHHLTKRKKIANQESTVKSTNYILVSKSNTFTTETMSSSVTEFQATVIPKVRQQIAKWQRSQTSDHDCLRGLKENVHFEVNANVKGPNNLFCL